MASALLPPVEKAIKIPQSPSDLSNPANSLRFEPRRQMQLRENDLAAMVDALCEYYNVRQRQDTRRSMAVALKVLWANLHLARRQGRCPTRQGTTLLIHRYSQARPRQRSGHPFKSAMMPERGSRSASAQACKPSTDDTTVIVAPFYTQSRSKS